MVCHHNQASPWLTNNVHVSTNLLKERFLSFLTQVSVRRPCHFGTQVYLDWELDIIAWTDMCFKVSAISHVNWHPLAHALFSHWGSNDFWWDPISSCSVNSHRSAEYRQKIHTCSLIWVVWFWKAIVKLLSQCNCLLQFTYLVPSTQLMPFRPLSRNVG
jgi:hypothetical protein